MFAPSSGVALLAVVTNGAGSNVQNLTNSNLGALASLATST